MGWGIGSWGTNEWGFQSEVLPPSAANPRLESIEIISNDLLCVTFNQTMVNDAELQSTDNYSVTPVCVGDVVVTVKEVRSGTGPTTTVIYLVISRFQIGAVYSMTIEPDNITAVNTESLNPLFVTDRFVGRRTKVDNMIKTPTALYNTESGSLIRQILNAIGGEDDLIGGVKVNDTSIAECE
jgi:hypothetical protein